MVVLPFKGEVRLLVENRLFWVDFSANLSHIRLNEARFEGQACSEWIKLLLTGRVVQSP